MRRKIAVIGAGNVGSTLALYLAQKELGDIVLVDIVEGVPQGKALDIRQAAPVFGFDVNVTGHNDYSAIQGSDLVVVTAGLARKPGMSRLDLLLKNAEIVKGITASIVQYAPNAIVILVSNPVDVMTYHCLKLSGFSPKKVLGQAGVLDSARYAAFIADYLNVSVKDISPMVLGGHGDEMVPLPKQTTVSGISVDKLIPADKLSAINERTRKGGAEIVELLKTGSAYYAPAAATCAMVESILLDQNRILHCSVLLNGEYGIKDVCVGVPAKLGNNGLEEIIKLDLSAEELSALQKSAGIYKESIVQL
ncbi:MAG: malate dehydrogenase [Candidatus Margulisiibacteriota bacterium]|jgi:malate dehydrogenase